MLFLFSAANFAIMSAGALEYHYSVDVDDRIVFVNTLWLAFARENGAVDLTQEAVIGKLLWKFLEGEATRSFYRALHAQVRATKQPAVIPFRCDSPSLRRYMRMTIHHEETGQLRYECRMVRTETQRHLKILHPTQARSRACLPVCSCCRRVLLEPMGWLEMLEMSVRLGLFEDELVPRFRHTICPECAIAPSER